MKKAQGISIETIIIAAIAVIVLIVLIAIFSGRLTLWGKDMDTVKNQKVCGAGGFGGELKQICGDDQVTIINFKDAPQNPGLVCCVFKSAS